MDVLERELVLSNMINDLASQGKSVTEAAWIVRNNLSHAEWECRTTLVNILKEV